MHSSLSNCRIIIYRGVGERKIERCRGGFIVENISEIFLHKASDVLENAKKNAKTALNLAMVYSYYEVGRLIVEEEQRGNERAGYGKYIIKELSAYLTGVLGKGYSVTNLKQMRQFYQVRKN